MELNMETYTSQLVTIPVKSEVDPAELLAIMHEIREHIIEMVEQQCIECEIDVDEISVTSCEMISAD